MMNTGIITLHIPIALKKRSGRKLILSQDGKALSPSPAKPDDTIVAALVKAYKWQRMLDMGKASCLQDIAEREAITPTYIARILRLNLLAPDIKEAILDGCLPKGVRLEQLMKPFPDLWEEQRAWLES